MNRDGKYTQREWDRVVGYGKVPDHYRDPKEPVDDEQLEFNFNDKKT